MTTPDPSSPQKTPPASIDWNEVHRRLDAARAASTRAWTPDREATQRILKARARALARPPLETTAADARLEVVEFRLAHERYAVESRFVREVVPLDNLTPLPCTPDFVLGIVNLRGEMLSVIDIKKFFDLPQKGLGDLHKIIVLEAEPMRFGILADTLAGVRGIPMTDIQPSLPTLTDIREEYLKGVTAERLVILDARKLLANKKIVLQEQVEG